MKLYDCTPAPSPRRVRIFLAEKGVEVPTVEVDLRNGEHLQDAFRGINPDCTVPVLELDDGTRITEIFAICQYLEDRYPEPPLLGRDAAARALVTMWNTKIEQHGLGAMSEMFRNKARGFSNRALTGPVDYEQIPELVERGRKRFEQFLSRLELQLEGREFVVGSDFSIADITAAVTIDFAGWAKVGIGDDRQQVRRWHESVAQRPSMQA